MSLAGYKSINWYVYMVTMVPPQGVSLRQIFLYEEDANGYIFRMQMVCSNNMFDTEIIEGDSIHFDVPNGALCKFVLEGDDENTERKGIFSRAISSRDPVIIDLQVTEFTDQFTLDHARERFGKEPV